MNLHAAQLISLIYNYNEYRKSGTIPPGYLDSMVFENCETVGYILLRNYVNRGGLDGEIAAANPIRWFKFLEKEDCIKLSLHYRLPEAAPANEIQTPVALRGTLFIEAIYKSYSNFWFQRWFKQKNSSGEESWNVRYFLAYRLEETIDEKVDLQRAKKRLHDVLKRCISYAADNDFLKWADIFSIAFNTLDSPQPHSVLKEGLLKNEASSLPVRQVLYATLLAFIGHEEDLWKIKFRKPENTAALKALMEEFYGALIESILAVANNRI